MITTDQILKSAIDWLKDNQCVDATPDTTARELDLDSLDVVEMVLHVEETFQLEIKESLEMKPDDTLRDWAERAAKELNR